MESPSEQQKAPPSIAYLLEGLHVPADPTNKSDFSPPPWLDLDKFKRGQRFTVKNFFSLCFAEFLALIMGFSFDSTVRPLVYSRKSSTPFDAFKRYVSTLTRLRTWYSEDVWSPDSPAAHNIQVVRAMHRHVRDRMNFGDPAHVARLSRLENACCPMLLQTDHQELLQPDPLTSSIHVNQFSMALTQFAFVGLAVLYPSKFGLNMSSDAELDAFVHMWAGLGYLLGSEDRYNFCLDGVAKCRERAADCIEHWVKPRLRHVDARWEHMSRCVIEGSTYYFAEIQFEAILCYLYWLLRIPLPHEIRSALSWRSHFFYLIYHVIFFILKYVPLFHNFFNWLLIKRLKKAANSSSDALDLARVRSAAYLKRHEAKSHVLIV